MKDQERWARVSAILAKALDLPEADRTQYLADACRREPALRTEVFSYFQEMRSANAYLEAPFDLPGVSLDDLQVEAFGSYRVIRSLGEGGMGVVYLAERSDGHFVRQVAIKRIGSVTPDAELLRRFRSEGEILGRLDHPNIARLFDAGVDAQGVPYLVMEYVDGVALTAWCRDRHLTVRQRLDLFLKLCDAVQHAHQNLVIHRDIKPGNILVTAAGEPKLLDFGIAKIFTPEAAGDVTQTIDRALSLDYASPEQVRGQTVTTATDVYSLGVLLFELLTDTRPHDASGKSLTDAVRTICEDTPERPSRIAPPARRVHLRGDLDAIVARAMEKAPAERYASVAELGAEVRAHLEHLPVKARRMSFGYTARKFARRHRTGTAVAAGVLLVIAAGMSGVVWQSRIAERERARAERRFQDVRDLANFVIYDLQDGVSKLAGSTELRKTMVERSIRYLDSLAGEAAGDRGLQLQLAGGYTRLADVQGQPQQANLGDRAGALSSYTKARRLLEGVLSEGSRDSAVRRQLARVLGQLHNIHVVEDAHSELAAQTLADTRQMWDGLLRDEPAVEDNLRGAATAQFLSYSYYYRIRPQDAGPYMERALEMFQTLLAARPGDGDRKRNVALCHKYLAGYLLFSDPARSLDHARRAAQLDGERVAANPHNAEAKLDYSFDLGALADSAVGREQYRDALRYYTEALALRRALWEADRVDVRVAERFAFMIIRVAEMHVLLAEHARGLTVLREALTRVADLPDDQRGSKHEMSVRSYAAMAEAQSALAQDHCAAARRVAELHRTRPLDDGVEPSTRKLVARAIERARACRS